MAQTFTGNPASDVKNFDLSATPNNVTQINLPSARRVLLSVQFTAANGKYVTLQSLADDGALGSNPAYTLPVGEIIEIDVTGLQKVFLASDTASTPVEVEVNTGGGY